MDKKFRERKLIKNLERKSELKMQRNKVDKNFRERKQIKIIERESR